MNLHLVFSSPNATPALSDCLKNIDSSDGLVLIEDGVYASIDSTFQNQINKCIQCYLVVSDSIARGLSPAASGENALNIKPISYDDLVDLTLNYDKTISWR